MDQFTSKKADRLKKYVLVARQCKWTPPLNNQYTESTVLDAAINVTLQNDLQINAIYIVIGMVPMLYTLFKSQLKDYINKYGEQSHKQELGRLKAR